MFVISLLLTIVITGVVFAQGKPAVRNFISLEASLIGGGARYEYILSDKFSIGGTAFWHTLFFFWDSWGAEGTIRYYPTAGNIYVELGVGYGSVKGTERYEDSDIVQDWLYAAKGVMVTPAVGVRIDFGKPGGFFINPMISIPMIIGIKDEGSGDKKFGFGFNVRPAIGFGYAF